MLTAAIITTPRAVPSATRATSQHAVRPRSAQLADGAIPIASSRRGTSSSRACTPSARRTAGTSAIRHSSGTSTAQQVSTIRPVEIPSVPGYTSSTIPANSMPISRCSQRA